MAIFDVYVKSINSFNLTVSTELKNLKLVEIIKFCDIQLISVNISSNIANKKSKSPIIQSKNDSFSCNFKNRLNYVKNLVIFGINLYKLQRNVVNFSHLYTSIITAL